MTPTRILEGMIDKAIMDRAWHGESEIRARVERGEKNWMPGALLRKLSDEERETLAKLTSDDAKKIRVDPWQVA
jgi:hypothetical protein